MNETVREMMNNGRQSGKPQANALEERAVLDHMKKLNTQRTNGGHNTDSKLLMAKTSTGGKMLDKLGSSISDHVVYYHQQLQNQ